MTPIWLKIILTIVLASSFVMVYLYFLSRIKGKEEEIEKRQAAIMNMLVERKLLLEERSATPALIQKLKRSEQVTVRDMLSDSNPRVRVRGIEILKEKLSTEEPEVAIHILLPFLEDRDNRVSTTAAKLLYKYSPQESIDALCRMARSVNIRTRISAAWTLGEIGGAQSVSCLEELLKDSSKHVARRAFLELQKMKDSQGDIQVKDTIEKLLDKYKSQILET